MATGFIACPCHFPITLPILITVLGGVGLGSFISENQGLIYMASGVYFVAGLAAGWYFLTRRKRGAPACDIPPNKQTRAVARRSLRRASR